ncbi:ABC transporter substrate-binding protein [Lentisphaerota bacterium]|nr:ABC transporter substrate-binding protein [Lentisphaerota bacterium]
MKHKGLLEKEFAKDGIKVKFHDIMNGPKQIEAAITGKVDICGSINTTSLIIAAGQNKKLNIIGAVCNPTDTLALMTNDPSIKSVKDLKGKTVACDKGATLHQLLLEILAKNNMTIKDINYVPMVLPEVYDNIFTGKINAGLLTTVETLKAKKRGARILATAKGLMRPKLVVAVSKPFAQKHPNWVGRYVKVQGEAMEFIKKHKCEALQLAAKDLGISYQDAEWLYENTNFTNTLNRDDLHSLKDDIDFLYQQKLIPKKVSILSQGAAVDIFFEDFVRDQISICALNFK